MRASTRLENKQNCGAIRITYLFLIPKPGQAGKARSWKPAAVHGLKLEIRNSGEKHEAKFLPVCHAGGTGRHELYN